VAVFVNSLRFLHTHADTTQNLIHPSAWRDCLESSWTGRIARLLVARSAQKGAFSPRCASSSDHEMEPVRSFQTVSGR